LQLLCGFDFSAWPMATAKAGGVQRSSAPDAAGTAAGPDAAIGPAVSRRGEAALTDETGQNMVTASAQPMAQANRAEGGLRAVLQRRLVA
jgi:hypothetical protein